MKSEKNSLNNRGALKDGNSQKEGMEKETIESRKERKTQKKTLEHKVSGRFYLLFCNYFSECFIAFETFVVT